MSKTKKDDTSKVGMIPMLAYRDDKGGILGVTPSYCIGAQPTQILWHPRTFYAFAKKHSTLNVCGVGPLQKNQAPWWLDNAKASAVQYARENVYIKGSVQCGPKSEVSTKDVLFWIERNWPTKIKRLNTELPNDGLVMWSRRIVEGVDACWPCVEDMKRQPWFWQINLKIRSQCLYLTLLYLEA